MKKSVAVAKEADAKKGVSPTKSDNSIYRARNEPERQLGSLRSVIGNIRRNGGTPSVESIAAELSGMPTGERAPALLALQQTHGNRYVQRVVAGIQAKLVVGQPGDIYEQEADRVADAVMQISESQVNRRPKEEKEEELIQAKEIHDHGPAVTPELEFRIHALRGGGQPLPESVRSFFEPRFGYDFSQVRVHTDTWAADTAKAANARAFTVGRDVVFGGGQYAPGTAEGRRLLAHELTHVLQQGLDSSVTKIQRVVGGNITQQSITEEWARDLMEDEFEEQIQIVRDHLATLTPSSDEFNAQRLNLQILEQEGNRRRQARICRRPSTQFPDFPRTYISEINVDLTSPNHNVTLTWTGLNASRGPTGPFHSSPGAGSCNLNCDDATTSHIGNPPSRCTPKGPRQVEKYACALSTDRRATNATFFNQNRGIALHYFPEVPNYPASHGCVRLESLHAAQLIYDNSRITETTVTVGGTWTGLHCYDASGRMRRR